MVVNLHFYSHGKLLLTGEYLVMYGAESLAIPVRFGQSMIVVAGENGYIRWEAAIQDRPWFDAVLDLRKNRIMNASDLPKAHFLEKAIRAARDINPGFLSGDEGYSVLTNLNYPQEWGLGSSSTFISNLAWWADVDPILLHRAVSQGSGYDVACARSRDALIYQVTGGKPIWQNVDYHPSYADHLFFVYFGTKQDTSGSADSFRKTYTFSPQHIRYISSLTRQLISAETIDSVIQVVEAHESFMSDLLNIRTVKSRLFPDFPGAVKSLGAWGGDFGMVATSLPMDEVKKYFENKGFPVLFEFREMIINK